MQVVGQNLQQNQIPQVQYCANPSPANTVPVQSQPTQIPVQNIPSAYPGTVAQQNIPTQVPPQYNVQYSAPQSAQYPQATTNQTPTPSGVNIQIFNPAVATPGASYNVNAPCYPSNYYTNPMGQGGTNGVNGVNGNGGTNQGGVNGVNGGNNGNNGNNGQAGQNGVNGVNGDGGSVQGGESGGNGGNSSNNGNNGQAGQNGVNGVNGNGGTNQGGVNGVNGGNNGNNGNNGQAGQNDGNGVNGNGGTNQGVVNGVNGQNGTNGTDGKKTEKKNIVQLSDEYIKNLENYLNSQDEKIRLSAAKEVYNRLEEDESRKDDKALTALINKMLQDPSEQIRILAISALEGRIVLGDDYTKGVLTNMQNSKDSYGQDAEDASKILLQMSGKQVQKEVPIKEKKKADDKKTEDKSKEKVTPEKDNKDKKA